MVSVKNSLLILKCCVCLLFQALNWNLNPLTVVSWLNIYMQVAYLNELYEVLLPQYPQQIFVQIAEVRLIPSFKYYFNWKKCFAIDLLDICHLVALGSLCAGYWLLGVYIWCTCSFCFVPLLLIWVDAESFRYIRVVFMDCLMHLQTWNLKSGR